LSATEEVAQFRVAVALGVLGVGLHAQRVAQARLEVPRAPSARTQARPFGRRRVRARRLPAAGRGEPHSYGPRRTHA
jgi:hypothetical protein